MLSEIKEVPIFMWIIIATLLLIQASWIFYDASKRGERKWLWGTFGLLNVPSNLIIYLIVTRLVMKTKKCDYCNKNIRKESYFCPYCGKEVN
ncbi:MAG: zinc ribbon domain-containing protein [Firmicutes bacterium]|nr:zinc ribbon domain-containing protein [Bacillota bacterium]